MPTTLMCPFCHDSAQSLLCAATTMVMRSTLHPDARQHAALLPPVRPGPPALATPPSAAPPVSRPCRGWPHSRSSPCPCGPRHPRHAAALGGGRRCWRSSSSPRRSAPARSALIQPHAGRAPRSPWQRGRGATHRQAWRRQGAAPQAVPPLPRATRSRSRSAACASARAANTA